MKAISTFKKFTFAAIAALFIAAAISFVLGIHGSAVPYDGDNTPALPSPQFNAYTGVPSYGDESDFVRSKVSTANAYQNVTTDTCAAGTRYTIRVYVHNGADQAKNNNGTGPSVAKDTKVKVAIPGNEASTFKPTGTITASNAATVTDDTTIACANGKTVKLSYVAGTAYQWNSQSGTQQLSDSIVSTGAPVGTMSPNGDVWGCWDQRVYVILQVEVKEVPKPEPSTAQCKVLDSVIVNQNERQARATITAATNNATVLGYEINWGDGSTSNNQTDTHTYAKDGSYTITGRVQVKYANGSTAWVTSANCKDTLEIKKPEKKVPYCQGFTLNEFDGRKVRANIVIIDNGATINNIEYIWDDGQSSNTTNRSAEHTYDADGTYNVSTKMTYTIDGKQTTVSLPNCAQPVTFGVPPVTPPETPENPEVPGSPEELPVTGPADVALIVAGVSVVSALGYRFFLGRRG